MTNIQNLTILDNGGATFDRYTIIERTTGEMIGASENPFHPQGFGQFCGNLVDNYMFVAYGYSWRKHCNVKVCIKSEVKRYLSDCSHVGNKIKWSELPEDVKKYALQAFDPKYCAY